MRAYRVEIVVYTDDATPEQVKDRLAMLQVAGPEEIEVSEVVSVTEVDKKA